MDAKSQDDRAEAGQWRVFLLHFCGKHQRKVRKLVRGFYAVICDECVDLCNSIIAEGGPSYSAASSHPSLKDYAAALCSFCGRSKDDVSKLIAGPPEQFICDECIELCNGIIAEAPGKVP